MNKAFSKLVCSAVAVVAMGAQAFAQTATKQDKCATSMFQQGDDGLGMNQFPAAYNTPAGISTKGWDVFFDGSFIYWHASQDQMDLGRLAGVATAAAGNPRVPATSSTVLFQDTTYNPGFKAGFGFNSGFDGWIGNVEYTWLHQTTTTSSTAPTLVTLNDATQVTGVWKPTNWFAGLPANANVAYQFTHVHSTWKLQMDLIDANVSRPFYQGRQLTVLPYAGLRSMFLRQALRIHGTYAFVPAAAPKMTSENISQSWSIGPNAGMNAHWIVGGGFRFEGFAGASILYTRYTKVAHDEHNQALTTTTLAPFVGRITQFGALRPVADAGVGFGWGSYFSNQDYHFDLLARYDFMVAWNQNVMRQLASIYSDPGIVPAAGDLYFHGATATLRFDF